jgi:hypothetical protein
MPSITEASRLQGIGTGVIRRALEALIADGLIVARRNQATVVAGEPPARLPGARRRPGPGHDCRRAGCQAHICRPLEPRTIHGIRGILSGAFAMAKRWEWMDPNPADSARPPAVNTRRSIAATPSEDVAKVIAQARAHSAALGLYLWLVVITGQRREELCGLQIRNLPPGSTAAAPPHALVIAAAVRPRCGTTPTQCRKSTGARRRTCHVSRRTPLLRRIRVGNSSSLRLRHREELVVPPPPSQLGACALSHPNGASLDSSVLDGYGNSSEPLASFPPWTDSDFIPLIS